MAVCMAWCVPQALVLMYTRKEFATRNTEVVANCMHHNRVYHTCAGKKATIVVAHSEIGHTWLKGRSLAIHAGLDGANIWCCLTNGVSLTGSATSLQHNQCIQD